jgi:membrane protein implicated in regulation of membrane protease activity
MEQSTIWWLLTGTLIVVELATGTFYLLMMAVGIAAAAIAAHLGLSAAVQIITAGIVGGGAVALWHWRRLQEPKPIDASRNPDTLIDIGQNVHVERWHVDGTATVKYRGANWTAILAATESTSADAVNTTDGHVTGNFRIKALQGSRLVLEKI